MPHAMAALCTAAALAAGNGSFDHSAFDRLLKAHVVDGMVDYDAFARAPGLPRYLDQLARARPDTLSVKEQLAYWINVYNAYTIQLVNAHEERKSIRNINKTLGVLKPMGPWKEEIVKAGGKTMSLDHVEHEIIRKRFQEPRIHFALVCAARSCPPLRREAYTGERLDAQLDDQARIFIAQSPDKNRVDVEAATVYLSPIFTWFRDDFGPDLGRFLARILTDMPSSYMSEDLARFGEMGRTNPKLYDLFMKWYAATMEKGALDERTKKLIALAVAYAIQEPYCIDSYASACADAGVSPEEMTEAVSVAAAIRGGGVIAHWVQACNAVDRKG